MMLLILDQNPINSVKYLLKTKNNKLLWNQLFEVMEIISSAYSFGVYPKLNQAKEIQEWVGNNPVWIYHYAVTLYTEATKYLTLSQSTKDKFQKVLLALYLYISKDWATTKDITDGVFRFSSKYNTNLNNNKLYPVEELVTHYRNYLDWKLEGDKRNEV